MYKQLYELCKTIIKKEQGIDIPSLEKFEILCDNEMRDVYIDRKDILGKKRFYNGEEYTTLIRYKDKEGSIGMRYVYSNKLKYSNDYQFIEYTLNYKNIKRFLHKDLESEDKWL